MVNKTTTIDYDYSTHKYFLKDEYLQENYGFSVNDFVKLDDTNDVEKCLKRISKVIYEYIYEYAYDNNEREKLEYIIANNDDLRDKVAEAQGEFCYSLYNEEFDNSYRNGIYGKTEISMSDLNNASVSLQVKRILHNSGVLFRGIRCDLDIDKIREAKSKGEF
nr:MAG TPA: hypothetical protein [Caudoviricetes sp.]